MWSILEKVSCAVEKNVYFAVVWYSILYVSIRPNCQCKNHNVYHPIKNNQTSKEAENITYDKKKKKIKTNHKTTQIIDLKTRNIKS